MVTSFSMWTLNAEKCFWVFLKTKTRRWNSETDETGETAEGQLLLSRFRSKYEMNLYTRFISPTQRGRGTGSWMKDVYFASDSKQILYTVSSLSHISKMSALKWFSGRSQTDKRLQEENVSSFHFWRTYSEPKNGQFIICSCETWTKVCEHAWEEVPSY